jgi:sulfatase modifying factor 1
MHQSPRLTSSFRSIHLAMLGAFALFSACVPILGIEEAITAECKTYVCPDNTCAFDFTPMGTPCENQSDKSMVCNGAGECKADVRTPCTSGAECASALCDETCKLNINDVCDNDLDCFTQYCFEGLCKLDDGDGCEVSSECGSNACVDTSCRNTDGLECANNVDCASGACQGNICLQSEGKPCSDNFSCARGICEKSKCTTSSCIGLSENCGSTLNESCCASIAIPGGTFSRGNNSNYPATISDFRLDRFEVNVARFRNFVNDYPSSRPNPGDGKHSTNSLAGWQESWNIHLPATAAELKTQMSKCGATATWSDLPGKNDNLPINCVDWYLAFAFCAWDAGRLPTEAEWNYAAAGGNAQRFYPWSDASTPNEIDASLAVYNCEGAGDSSVCLFADIVQVGSKSLQGDGRWGQADLAGSMFEWTLDWFDAVLQTPCMDCATTTESMKMTRVLRGGSWYNNPTILETDFRTHSTPSLGTQTDIAGDQIGFRCARNL